MLLPSPIDYLVRPTDNTPSSFPPLANALGCLRSPSFIPIPLFPSVFASSLPLRGKANPLAVLDPRDPSCSQSRAASFISRRRADPGEGVGGEEIATAGGAQISQLLVHKGHPPHNRDEVAQRERQQGRDKMEAPSGGSGRTPGCFFVGPGSVGNTTGMHGGGKNAQISQRRLRV